MTALLFRRLLRDLWAMKGRALVTAVIIAAGVSLSAGVIRGSLLLQSSADAYWERLNLAGYSLGYGPVLPAEVPDVADVVPAAAVTHELRLPGVMTFPDGQRVPLTLYGRDPAGGDLVRSVPGSLVPNQLRSQGETLPGWESLAGCVALDRGMSDARGVGAGDVVVVEVAGLTRSYPVCAVVVSPEYLISTSNPAYLVPVKGSQAVAWTSLDEAQALAGAPVVNRTLVGVPLGQAEEGLLRERFGPLGVVEAADRRNGFGARFLRQHMGSFSSFVPPMVIVFTIVTTVAVFVSMNRMVTLQRAQIGALRAAGMGRFRLIRTYTLPGTLIGFLGAVVGVFGASGLGWVIGVQYADAVGLPGLVWAFTPWPGVLASVVATLVATGAALVPAWRIVMLPPRQALQSAGETPQVASGAVVMRLLAGAPMLVRLVARGTLGRRVATVTAAAGIGLSLALAIVWLSLMRTLDDSVAGFFAGDRWTAQVALSQSLTPEQVAQLGTRLGIVPVPLVQVPVTVGKPGQEGVDVVVTGLPELGNRVDLLAGDATGLVVSEFVAERLGIGIGTAVVVTSAVGERQAAVSGLTRGLIGDRAFLGLAQAQDLAGTDRVQGFLLEGGLDPGTLERLEADPAVAMLMEKAVAQQGFTQFQDQMQSLVLTAVLLSAISAAAVLWSGVAVLLLERAAEFAALRARGLRQREVVGMVGLECGLRTLAGAVLAIPATLLIVYPLTASLSDALRTTLTVSLAWQDFALVLVPALVSVPVLALVLGRQVSRQPLAQMVRRTIPV